MAIPHWYLNDVMFLVKSLATHRENDISWLLIHINIWNEPSVNYHLSLSLPLSPPPPFISLSLSLSPPSLSLSLSLPGKLKRVSPLLVIGIFCICYRNILEKRDQLYCCCCLDYFCRQVISSNDIDCAMWIFLTPLWVNYNHLRRFVVEESWEVQIYVYAFPA